VKKRDGIGGDNIPKPKMKRDARTGEIIRVPRSEDESKRPGGGNHQRLKSSKGCKKEKPKDRS